MSNQSDHRARLFGAMAFSAIAAGMLTVPTAQAWEINVERGDSLMIIAERTREAQTTTVEQQALAILELNPEAFAKDNVNGLRSGSSLAIPDQQQAERIDPEEAVRLMRQHNADWNDGMIVQRGEQLMVIAAETRESRTTTVDQQALALLELNPHAFAGGNINGLRWGSRLKLPTREEAESIEAHTAAGRVDQHHREWAQGEDGLAGAQLAQTREVTIIRGARIQVTDLRY